MSITEKNNRQTRLSTIKKPWFWLSMILMSSIFGVCGEMYWILGRVCIPAGNLSALAAPQLWQIAALFVVGMVAFPILYLYWEKITGALYKYRYLLALCLLIILVAFEISFSSLGMWSSYLPGGASTGSGTLFGIPRAIRGDEFGVNIPAVFSQYKNTAGEFSYFNELLRGTATDGFLVAAQPVWDIGILFRPMYWGFLFLSPAKGLSFFWCARLIAVFLVSFEISMLLTKGNKTLSVFGAALLSSLPFILWWGSMEQIIYGLGAVVLINKYMLTESYKKRCLIAVGLIILTGGFIMIIYPAWQIPMAYIILALIAGIAITNWKKFRFNWKKDVPIILIAGGILVGITLHVLTKSADTIRIIGETVYPGDRFATGGGAFTGMFQYLGNLLFPLSGEGLPLNVCEMSTAFDLAPLPFILGLIVLVRKKGHDWILNLLMLCNVFFTIYISIGFPHFLSKITFLSNTYASRLVPILGILNILILVRAASQLDFKINPFAAGGVALGCTAFTAYMNTKVYGDYLSAKVLIVLSAVLFVFMFLVLMCRKKSAQAVLACMAVIIVGGSGFLINPVQKGANCIYENPLYTAVENVAEKDDGKWLAVGMAYPLTNFPIIAGAPTINSTNPYPNMELWKKLDSKGEYEEIYNRYAHISVDFQTEADTSFELLHADAFALHLNVSDLKKLDVEYIFAASDMELYSQPGTSFKLVDKVEPYGIYQVIYS